jgi:prephenate dehydrogenase
MKSLDESIFAIVGLGLMGGSFAMALRAAGACKAILGITRDPATLDQALTDRVIDEASQDLSLASKADVLVLATPVRTIIKHLGALGPLAGPRAIILDLGSTKHAIVHAMEQLPSHLEPIGGHPMCGKEQFGFSAADANLYRYTPFILSPLARTSPDTIAFARSVVTAVGARPVLLDPARHDRIMAAISHLPFILASVLMMTAGELAKADDLLLSLAAGGFRDTSRLAASETTMMLDILMTNSENVSRLLRSFGERLTDLADDLDRQDENALYTILHNAAAKRRELYQKGIE